MPRSATATIAPARDPRALERARCARLIRDAVVLLSSKWAVDLLLVLGHGTRRYHELLGELAPISEKVLTQTLRAMERDGLIARRVYDEVPLRVEYELTPLGASLAAPLKVLGNWSLKHGDEVGDARQRFDERLALRASAGTAA